MSRSPRVLEVDLVTGEASLGSFSSEWPELRQVAAWSGSALAWALQADASRSGAAPPFVMAVGEAVRRGVPTAARLSVCGLGAHTGKISEGAVGGSLGRRLATVADALVLRGRAPTQGQVLILGSDGAVRWSVDCGTEPLRVVLDRLESEHPDAGQLVVGSAALRGVSYANLAAGGAPPSFVGRGGLGSTLAAMGVRAIIVEAPEVAPDAENEEWTAQLKGSPRLRERGSGGSLERAFEASLGEVEPLEREAAEALAAEGPTEGVGLRGCAGCPTPCGWVFETPEGGRGGARFNAMDSLGSVLGLVKPEEIRQVLGVCDEIGVDAKEAGAAMAVLARARSEGACGEGPRMGEVGDFTAALRQLARGEEPGWTLSAGAEKLASRYGQASPTARGEAVRPRHGLGGALAAEVAARGAEPMRTFSFLLEGGVTLERARHLVAPLELSRSGLEQANPKEKGRLVWWHENFVAGLDSTGFCAFSAAGVLADGVMDLDELGARLLSEKTGSSPGEELLARGASLCLLAREVGGATGAPPQAALAEPWAEYIALRGLDQRGEVLPEAAAAVGDLAVLRWERAAASGSVCAPPSGASSERGEVSFSGTGGVERALGGRVQVSLAFPVTLEEALEVLAEEHVALRTQLFVKGAAIATAWRDGERVELDEELAVGDHLDLILAVGGG